MKKNVILISLIIVVLIIGVIMLITKYNKVEKFSEIKIVDSYGNEITNYEANYMPFTIQKNNKEQKISVNGIEHSSGTRFYKPGEYEIKVSYKGKREKSTIKINAIEKKNENEYNIYIIPETLQVLLMNLDISKDKEQKGYFWTARTSSIDMQYMQENFKNIKFSEYNGKEYAAQIKEVVLPEIQRYIKEVLQKNPKAYFKLHISEDEFYLDLELFGKIGLDDSRYEVDMYTNGTLGYVTIYEMTQKDKYDRFIEEKQKYMEIVEKIKNDTLNYNNYPGSYLTDSKSEVFYKRYNLDYMLISTLRDNIKFLTQYPEIIKFEDEKIAEEMKNANIKKIKAQEEYAKLDEEQKATFLQSIKLNKEELDKNYFTNSEEKYLVITGTRPFYGKMQKEEFETIIRKVCKDYEDYKILYKPHPTELPDKENTKFLNSLGIKILPGAIPMEAILFIYPNLKIGGFGSSLYLSADAEKTMFFFTKDKTELVNPLNELCDTIFENVKFYN